MGGHGSGRPPNAKTLIDRQLGRNKQNEILPAGDSYQIPNYAGVVESLSSGAQEFNLRRTIDFRQQSATGDGTTTMDWRLGNKFFFTFGAQNELFTFTSPNNTCNLLLVLKQDSVGSRTITWPVNTKWVGGATPVLTTAANATDIVSFYYDGSDFYGVGSLNFTTVT